MSCHGRWLRGMNGDRNRSPSWPQYLGLWHYPLFGVAGRLGLGVRFFFCRENRLDWRAGDIGTPVCLNNDVSILPFSWTA
jgi:hypothetical protein